MREREGEGWEDVMWRIYWKIERAYTPIALLSLSLLPLLLFIDPYVLVLEQRLCVFLSASISPSRSLCLSLFQIGVLGNARI